MQVSEAYKDFSTEKISLKFLVLLKFWWNSDLHKFQNIVREPKKNPENFFLLECAETYGKEIPSKSEQNKCFLFAYVSDDSK